MANMGGAKKEDTVPLVEKKKKMPKKEVAGKIVQLSREVDSIDHDLHEGIKNLNENIQLSKQELDIKVKSVAEENQRNIAQIREDLDQVMANTATKKNLEYQLEEVKKICATGMKKNHEVIKTDLNKAR